MPPPEDTPSIHVNITGGDFRAQQALHDTTEAVGALSDKTVTIEGNQMFARFTDRARRVCVLAQEEARTLNHNYIGTEHFLLGLIHEGEGVAAKALKELGVALEDGRQQIEEIIGKDNPEAPVMGHIPYTPRAKKVLELALREALQLGHNYIGTEHILLGLIREGEGVGAQVLTKLGADLNRVRQQVLQILAPAGQKAQRAMLPVSGVTVAPVTLPAHSGNVCPKCPGTEVDTNYQAQISYSKILKNVVSFEEFLHRECQKCGYSWNESCRT